MTLLQEFSVNEQIVWRNVSASTLSSSYVDFGTVGGNNQMEVTFTKVLDSSVIVVELYTSCYLSTGSGSADWGVRIDGVDYDVIQGYQDNSGNHRGYGATKEITGIAAGEYTIQVRWRTSAGGFNGYLTTDSNDTQSVVVREKKVPL